LSEQLREAQAEASFTLHDLNTLKYIKDGFLPFDERIGHEPVNSYVNFDREKINEGLFSSNYEDDVKKFKDLVSFSQLRWGPFGVRVFKFDNKEDLEKILTAQNKLERRFDQQFLEINNLRISYDDKHDLQVKNYRAGFLASLLVAVESGLFGLYLAFGNKKE
jgi:hypothetical protein